MHKFDTTFWIGIIFAIAGIVQAYTMTPWWRRSILRRDVWKEIDTFFFYASLGMDERLRTGFIARFVYRTQVRVEEHANIVLGRDL